MKQFFKFMLASMTAQILLSLIGFVIFLSMVISAVSFSKKDIVIVKDNSVLCMKLDKPIADRTSDNPFGDFDFVTFESQKSPGLDKILQAIKNAATDNQIKGIFLDLTDIPAGMATLGEIRNALMEFKKSGKFIISYSEYYSQKAYYLATAADQIYLNPEGGIIFKGLAAELMFFKGTLEKLDVQMQIVRHGKFKSAIEPLVNDKMSDENREQYMKMLAAIWSDMIDATSKARDVDAATLNMIADSLKVQFAEDAITHKLADKLFYRDEVLDELRSKLGIDANDKINFIALNKYAKVKPEKKKHIAGKKKIALIYAIGSIGPGQGNETTIGSDKLSEAIREARNDSSVRAIVLRINSPGGSALASEVIWREVVLAKKVKPVVVSMGDLAASGGYYIACGATKIYADPNTLTGSIGVFGVIPNLQNFFKNKLGITFDVVKTNANSDYIPVSRAMTAYETTVITNQIERIYQVFIKHVAEGRNLTVEQVDTIGQGRIWSGKDAKLIGLVDELGGIDQAIAEAAKLAGLEDYKIVNYPKYKDPITKMIEEMIGETETRQMQKVLGENYIYYQYLQQMQNLKGVQARLPFEVVIY